MTRACSFGAAVALLVASLCLGGCSAAPQIPVKAMPPGANFTGLWYSNHDDMNLVQSGNEVQGTFEYKSGGVINGALQGGVLLFDWVFEPS